MPRWFRRNRAAYHTKLPAPVRPRVWELEARLTPADIYVATTGSDSGAGSLSAPYATLARGIAAADPGDHVVLRGGTYAGAVTIDEPDLTIRSYSGEWAIISSPTTNSSIQQTIQVDTNADRLTLSRLEIVGGYYYTVKTETTAADGRGNAATQLLIEDCKLHGSGRDVIKLTPGSDDATIRRTEIYDSGRRDASNAEGIDNVNADRMTVQDSHIHDIATYGIYPKGGTIGSVIERTVITDCGQGGVAVGFYTDAEFLDPVANPDYYESIDTVVRNNIIARTGYAGVGFYASEGSRVYNNTLVDVAQSAQAGVVLSNIDHVIDGQTVYQRNVDPVFLNNVVVVSSGRPAVEIRADSLSGAAVFGDNLYHRPGGSAQFKNLNTDPLAAAVHLAGWQLLGYDAGSFEDDPRLDGSYHLQADSPAIDAGRAVDGLTDDIDREARTGTPDIGADEQVTPQVSGVVVNAAAVQRSRVTEIAVTFDMEVDASLLATAFTLTRVSDAAVVGTVMVSTRVMNGQTVPP